MHTRSPFIPFVTASRIDPVIPSSSPASVSERERGSALVYILIAIALLALLTSVFVGDSSNQQATAQNSLRLVTEFKNQINVIRTAIDECAFVYPNGDITMPPANPVGGQNPIRPYPLQPDNAYLSGPSTSSLVKDIRCPGIPGNSSDHARIFAGSSGRFLPPPPNLFDPWLYYNNTDGVFFMAKTSKTDLYIDLALKKLDEEYSACEVQYIDAASAVQTTSHAAAAYACPANNRCLVVRVITRASAVYPGETGCS
ncbi:MAG: hypothetical protein WC989_09315 [Micavibrio sp.]